MAMTEQLVHARASCTLARLHEIQQSHDPIREKEIRASVNLCSLLRDLSEHYCSAETKATIKDLIDVYLHLS
jgi:hypothetical protein